MTLKVTLKLLQKKETLIQISEYDIGSDFESDKSAESVIDWENENESVPQNMDNSQLTPRGMSMSPANNVHVPADYVPASPIYSPYSPTSPDYSPSMSPLNIDSDTLETTPTTNSPDGIISRKDCDMFDMSNSDSDIDLEGEVETKSLVGEFINRGKLPEKLHGIFIFPQPTNTHNLTWDEYPFEPCGDHCVTPERSDKSIAKFYLTHSLCLKHRFIISKHGAMDLFNQQGVNPSKITQEPTNCSFHKSPSQQNKM